MTGGTVADVPVVGQFMLVRGYDRGLLNGEIYEVAKVTDKTVTGKSGNWRPRRHSMDDVIAAFGTEKEAERLRDTLAGIGGEMKRRISAAKVAADEAARAAIARATGEASHG